jgi:hypothetical protein
MEHFVQYPCWSEQQGSTWNILSSTAVGPNSKTAHGTFCTAPLLLRTARQHMEHFVQHPRCSEQQGSTWNILYSTTVAPNSKTAQLSELQASCYTRNCAVLSALLTDSDHVLSHFLQIMLVKFIGYSTTVTC